jgi:alkanesulfonate monooxygenase SsuD/methylene tetrahydromethanopterin reductase-like flavin-dependent oxidoreductase (luciferase family)
MVAIIGGETHRFRPLVDLYREAGTRAGHPPERLKVGMHSPGYVAATMDEAADDYFPGFAKAVSDIGKERGWSPMTRRDFDAQLEPEGALLIGDPDTVAQKILRHSEALGGLSRVTFQMNAASLAHQKLMRSMELIGNRVIPAVHEKASIGK